MRLSVQSLDPGYKPMLDLFASNKYADFYLNGQLANDVLTADTSNGYVLRLRRDSHGDVVVIGGNVMTEELSGQNVAIKVIDL